MPTEKKTPQHFLYDNYFVLAQERTTVPHSECVDTRISDPVRFGEASLLVDAVAIRTLWQFLDRKRLLPFSLVFIIIRFLGASFVAVKLLKKYHIGLKLQETLLNLPINAYDGSTKKKQLVPFRCCSVPVDSP